MKKTKSQSGITLIALIITILVLLILAGVAIKSIQDGGILTKAEQAADKYAQAQNDEQEMLDEYVAEIALMDPKIGAVPGLNVGDFIKYDDNTDNNLYIVLHNSTEQGLQIIATEVKSQLTLKGLDGFENRIQKFKQACAPYVKKSLGAIDGRVPLYTFNDINNLKIAAEYSLKLSDGTIRNVKCYGRPNKNDITVEENSLATAFTKMIQNNISSKESIWIAPYTDTSSRKRVQY